MLCNQKGCGELAVYRFTWPGQNEAGVCERHSKAVTNVANAMGCYIQLIPLDTQESDGLNPEDSDGDPAEP